MKNLLGSLGGGCSGGLIKEEVDEEN
jgi:hypothetical protein